MFSLKKWNAVAMWSWDVECDTCAICRVQVMGKRCTLGPGCAPACAGPGPGQGTSEGSERPLPGGVGAGIALPRPVLWRPPGAVGSLNRRTVPGAGFSGEKPAVNRGIKQDNFR